jgi:hypothetical protein
VQAAEEHLQEATARWEREREEERAARAADAAAAMNKQMAGTARASDLEKQASNAMAEKTALAAQVESLEKALEKAEKKLAKATEERDKNAEEREDFSLQLRGARRQLGDLEREVAGAWARFDLPFLPSYFLRVFFLPSPTDMMHRVSPVWCGADIRAKEVYQAMEMALTANKAKDRDRDDAGSAGSAAGAMAMGTGGDPDLAAKLHASEVCDALP